MKQDFETPEQIGKQLVRAAQDRHHAWRTPVLATVDASGMPNARTVVLQDVHRTGATAVACALDIYADRRSPKTSELAAQPMACLVFWSARVGWQLRVRVVVSVKTDGPLVASLWQLVRQTRSGGGYMAVPPPGASLPRDYSTQALSTADHETQSTYFAVLKAQVLEIDWLELRREQHRRAKMVGNDW